MSPHLTGETAMPQLPNPLDRFEEDSITRMVNEGGHEPLITEVPTVPYWWQGRLPCSDPGSISSRPRLSNKKF